MSTTTPDLSFLPLTLADTTLVGWDGYSYVDERGRTYWSGAAEPSAADAADCLAAPRTPPTPVAPPREISKLTLRRRIRSLGKEAAFDAALDAVPNARADWDDAQVLRTDDPLFTTQAAAFKAALALSDEQFSALLAP